MPGHWIRAYDRDLDRYRLDNGLKVILAPSRLAPVVAVQAWVGVGSASESAKQSGIAHVFEHMLFKGTARRGVGEIARQVEAAGGEINAWTSFNETVFHVVLASRYFDTAVDVLADALQNPVFDLAELDREREVVLEEIRQSHDDPVRKVARTLFETAYQRHPYRRPVIGTAEVVRSIRSSQLEKFLRDWYIADNTTLLVAGDFEPRRAKARIKRRFGTMPSRELRRRTPREPRQSEPRVAVRTQEVNETQLAFGFHIPRLDDELTPALDLAAVLLGQGESSRLASNVMREREIVSSIYAYAHTMRDRGLFVVSATLRPENLRMAVEAISQEVYRLAHVRVGSEELEKARHAIEADAVYQGETAQGIARKLGFYETVAGDAEFETEYLDRVRRVSAEELRRAAARYLALPNTTVATVVPHRGSHRTARGRAAEEKRLTTCLERGLACASRPRSTRVRRSPGTDDDLLREVLPNGMRIIVKRDRSVPIVAMRAVWTGGVRLETPRNNGITNLLAATIARGGFGSHPAGEVSRLVDGMAGLLAGSSGRNSFSLRAEWLASTWERGFDLVAESILEPHFSDETFLREKRRLLDEIEVRQDDPGVKALRLFAETLYRRHPYRMDTLGTAESVTQLERKQICDYYARTFPVSHLTLAVVGDLDPERVFERGYRHFGELARRTRKARKIPQEKFFGRSEAARNARAYLDRKQAHLFVGFPGTTLDDSDRFALEVLNCVLGGQGGRLFVELRDRRGLAYRVGALSVEGIDPGYIVVYLACSPAKLPAARAVIRQEMDRVADSGVTEEEIERAITYLIGVHEISLQRRSVVASALAFHDAYGIGYDQHRHYAATMHRVTSRDVQRVASEYLRWDLAVSACVEPPSKG